MEIFLLLRQKIILKMTMALLWVCALASSPPLDAGAYESIESRVQLLEHHSSRQEMTRIILRYQTLLEEIPELCSSTFPQQSMQLLELLFLFFKQAESYPLILYPTALKYPDVHFISHLTSGSSEPVAVLKKGEREREMSIWEMACLLNLDPVFTPSVAINFEGERYVLQPFEKSALSPKESYLHAARGYLTRQSFLLTALSVMVFALEDMHSENFAYLLQPTGRLELKMFDYTNGLTHPNPFPYVNRHGQETVGIPFHWIGWDFSQATQPCNPKMEGFIRGVVGSWPQKLLAIARYSDDPLLLKRIGTLHQLILYHQRLLPLEWLYTLSPEVFNLHQIMASFCPALGASEALFLLQWNLDRLLAKIPPERHSELLSWLVRYRLSIEK